MAELYWAAQNITLEADILHSLDDMLGRLLKTVGAADGSISTIEAETDDLVFLIVHGEVREQLIGFRFSKEKGIAGWVLQEQEPVIVDNPHQDWRFSLEVDSKFSFSTRSLLCVPIIYESEEIGVIQMLNKGQGKTFTPMDVTISQIFSDIVAKGLLEVRARTHAKNLQISNEAAV